MWVLASEKKRVREHIFLTVATSRLLTLKAIIEKYAFLKDLKNLRTGIGKR